MYEKPTVNRVGQVEQVVLGIAVFGTDLDTTWIPGGNQLADDAEPVE